MLVGICGKAGSGKDTVGDYLVRQYGFKHIALADPIKRLVEDVFVLDKLTVYDRVKREQPLERWPGWTVRKLLQFIGTELFRDNIDDSIWVKSLWYRICDDKDNNYVVTDIRFPNELQYFKDNASKSNMQFISLKTVREGFKGEVGLKGHASEAYDLDAEYVLENNGTFHDLYSKVNNIIPVYLNANKEI